MTATGTQRRIEPSWPLLPLPQQAAVAVWVPQAWSSPSLRLVQPVPGTWVGLVQRGLVAIDHDVPPRAVGRIEGCRPETGHCAWELRRAT